MYEVAFKAVDILFEARSQEAVEQSDYVIDVALPEATVFGIKKLEYCFNIGYITAITKIQDIKKRLAM